MQRICHCCAVHRCPGYVVMLLLGFLRYWVQGVQLNGINEMKSSIIKDRFKKDFKSSIMFWLSLHVMTEEMGKAWCMFLVLSIGYCIYSRVSKLWSYYLTWVPLWAGLASYTRVGCEAVLFNGLSHLFYSHILLSYPVELFFLLSRPDLPIITRGLRTPCF